MYKIYIAVALCLAVCMMPANAAPVVELAKITDTAQNTCVDGYNACKAAPGANPSTCASNISSCLGYSPFSPDGSFKLRS